MYNYLLHMNWNEMGSELLSINGIWGRKLMLIVASMVDPNLISYPQTIEDVFDSDMVFAEEYLLS